MAQSALRALALIQQFTQTVAFYESNPEALALIQQHLAALQGALGRLDINAVRRVVRWVVWLWAQEVAGDLIL